MRDVIPAPEPRETVSLDAANELRHVAVVLARAKLHVDVLKIIQFAKSAAPGDVRRPSGRV